MATYETSPKIIVKNDPLEDHDNYSVMVTNSIVIFYDVKNDTEMNIHINDLLSIVEFAKNQIKKNG
jgi:hypothetical protein